MVKKKDGEQKSFGTLLTFKSPHFEENVVSDSQTM